MNAFVRVSQYGVTLYTHLIIRYYLLIFPAEADSREEGVFVNVFLDLIQDGVGHRNYSFLLVILISEERTHLIA